MSVIREVPFPSPDSSELPMNIWIDDADSAIDVIDALALSPFATGVQPWSRLANLERVRPDAPLAPRRRPGAAHRPGRGRLRVSADLR
ncbi:DUF5925 domain-containing protein [Nonomuraea salmonea]|uniref:DUF5925 domain-containing protein n=1 Tax=Nonomuraea salmonea TaxID=46181 RepID=UPI002FE94D34